jgi:hypothetical protein
MKKTLAAAAVAALALIAAGCGGDESPTASAADEWADEFCTAITTWTDSLQNVTDQFSSASALSRDGLQDAANDVQSSTETLVDDLRGLGRPETESGTAVESSVDELTTTLETEVANIESAAQGASGLTEIPSAISSITTSLSAMATAFASTLDTIESEDAQGELRTALEDSPACADLSS